MGRRRTRAGAAGALRLILAAGALLVAGCSAEPVSDVESVLARAREATGLAGSLDSMHTVADCVGPGGAYRTEMRAARDGRAVMVQEYPDGRRTRYDVDGDSVRLSITGPWGERDIPQDAPEVKSLEPRFSTFVFGHELHVAALAPDMRQAPSGIETGVELDGEPAVALIWADVLGGKNRAYYRESDGLPLGLEIVNHLGGTPRVSVRFGRWEEENGVLLFRKAIISSGGDEFHFDFTRVEVNPPAGPLFQAD